MFGPIRVNVVLYGSETSHQKQCNECACMVFARCGAQSSEPVDVSMERPSQSKGSWLPKVHSTMGGMQKNLTCILPSDMHVL